MSFCWGKVNTCDIALSSALLGGGEGCSMFG